jgi:hypothetical protein
VILIERDEAMEIKDAMKGFCLRVMRHPEEACAGEAEALPHVLKLLLSYFSCEGGGVSHDLRHD